MAKFLFREARVVHNERSPCCISEPIPMRKLPTGTPDTGEPYVRCGGRGGHTAIPTPIMFPASNLVYWGSSVVTQAFFLTEAG